MNPDCAPPKPYRAAAEAIAAGAVGAPAVRADFDLFLDGAALPHFREPSFPEDTEPRAHLSDRAPASASREPRGFENPDFAFPGYGARFDGKRAAIVDSPESGPDPQGAVRVRAAAGAERRGPSRRVGRRPVPGGADP